MPEELDNARIIRIMANELVKREILRLSREAVKSKDIDWAAVTEKQKARVKSLQDRLERAETMEEVIGVAKEVIKILNL